MKRIFAVVLMAVAILVGQMLGFSNNTIEAAMPRMQGCVDSEKLYLGGLTCWDSYEKVKSIYGKPDRIDFTNRTLYYGNSLKISFNDGGIWSIIVTADNGFETPDHLKVGSSEEDMKRIYYREYQYQPREWQNKKSYFAIEKADGVRREFIFTVSNGYVTKIQLSVRDD